VLETAVVLIVAITALFGVAAWRLSHGPIAADFLRPTLIDGLSRQVGGGKASVNHIGIVWFDKAKSLGVEMDGLSLRDDKGRVVLRAAKVQAAVALDSLLVFAPAPGRIAAEDFFVAVSVSNLGRYELGYEAAGQPQRLTLLGRLFGEVTQPAKRGRWASFLRDLELTHGQLALKETSGSVSWVGDVHRMTLRKAGGRLDAVADVTLGKGPGRAELSARARASVGLREAFVEGRIRRLNPSKVFPSVGLTRALSALDAQVNGRGSIDYALDRGVRAADVAFAAGAGHIRFGKVMQRFDRAQAQASYDPESGEVELAAVKVSAAPLQLDMKGRIRLIPEGRDHQPARLDFDIAGSKVVMAFVPRSEPQTLRNLRLQGQFTPEAGRLTLVRGQAQLAGASVEAKGDLMQAIGKDGRPQGRWGARLEAWILDGANVDQAYPFWPDTIGTPARLWVKSALKAGRLSNVKLTVDVPPGTAAKGLSNDMLKVGFDFDHVTIVVVPGLPPIEDGKGSALVQGNRFDLAVTSGRMEKVRLSEGVVSYPHFNPVSAGLFKARAKGPADQILDILNRAPLRLLAQSPFRPDEITGDADVSFTITRPSLEVVAAGDYGYDFAGTVRQGAVHKVALGLDLRNGAVTVRGNNAGMRIAGPAKVGIYQGDIDFGLRFQGPDVDRGRLALKGLVALDARHPVPLTGDFSLGQGGGRGRFVSEAITGDLSWVLAGTGPEAAGKVLIDGRVAAGGLGRLGLPISNRTDGFDLNVDLNYREGAWRGPLRAGALAGDLAIRPGDRADISFAANVTPKAAATFGLGHVPLFAVNRPLLVTAAISPEAGNADVTLGGMQGQMGWTRRDDGTLQHQWRSFLSAQDLRSLGAPSLLRPPEAINVEATLLAGEAGLSGDVRLAGAPVHFDTIAVGPSNRMVTLSGLLTTQSARQLGLFRPGEFEGVARIAGRLDLAGDTLSGGHLEADLGEVRLAPAGTDVIKPLQQPAVVSADFTASGDEAFDLSQIRVEGPQIDLLASGRLDHGQIQRLQTQRAMIKDLFYGQAGLVQEGATTRLTVRGTFMDARRLMEDLKARFVTQQPEAAGAADQTLQLDLALDRVRMTDGGSLHDLVLNADWAMDRRRRFKVSAAMDSGAVLTLEVTPRDDDVAVLGEIGNVGEAASILLGTNDLRGGTAKVVGKLEPGGADLILTAKNLRVARVPVLAQILTLGSLSGVANTLNGEGIAFAEVSAPMTLEGSVLTLRDARATGEALGLTTHGTINLAAGTMDLSGGMAPAYALNSAVGRVPVLGALMISRQGEGVFGLTYSAKGPVKAPRVFVNPLSLATPGMLRRVFDGVPLGKAVFKAPPPKPEP
jgi:hypothetical protein